MNEKRFIIVSAEGNLFQSDSGQTTFPQPEADRILVEIGSEFTMIEMLPITASRIFQEIQQTEIIVTVKGGVAEVYKKPAGITVKIVDYDHGDADPDTLDTYEGHLCLIAEYKE